MRKDHRLSGRALSVMMLCLAALFTNGCESPGSEDGRLTDRILLPTDTLLNLACPDVGINGEQCVLEDPENPFAFTPISEFNTSTGDLGNKFELFNQIPAGPTGAKARFYFWATALAQRQSGENQFYTALALHELWDLNSDPIIQEQALKAYRSVLDNFFGSVTVFTCCEDVRPPDDPRGPVAFPIGLNELTADVLYRTDATGLRRLVEGDPLLVIELLLTWGYQYRPANPPDYTDGLVFVITG